MSVKSVRRNAKQRLRSDPEQVSARILDVFSATAKRVGIRALLMTELASELRISATTLYKMFPSKEALAMACVDRWADELGASEVAKRSADKPRNSFEQYLQWIDAWADANAALSPAFARDLKSDYPAVWQRYREVIEDRKKRGANLLRPLLKPEVNDRLALALLNTIFVTVLDPEFADRLDISRREALRTAVSIWASGALATSGKRRAKPKPKR
jgi:AcrR family transcriptional regulator